MTDQTIVVTDGCPSACDLSPVRPADLDAMRTWFLGISTESRYMRFLGHVSDLSPALWRYLTHVDGQDHVALLARIGDQIVGVGRWIRDVADPTLAEIAFLIDDHHQRRGIGGILRDALVAAARSRGIQRIKAHALPTNRGIRRLLASPQLMLVRSTSSSFEVELRAEP